MFIGPSQRKPFPGVVELYNAFVQGESGNDSNPIFYVSSSHWYIYEFLVRFFKLNGLPKGPLLLKEVSSMKSIITSVGNHSHKEVNIRKILASYPGLHFILIGDSGQRDAHIYAEIAKEYSDRIRVIYLRDVTTHEDVLVNEAKNELGESVEIVLAKTSADMAQHAHNHGYIKSLPEVKKA